MKRIRKKCRGALIALIIIASVSAVAVSASAAVDDLTIGQVSVNKPEVTVFFDLPEDGGGSGLPEAEARLGGEALTPISVEPFETSGEGAWYIFVVDCSTSMTAAQIAAIRDAITETAENMGAKDRVTVITFGVTVDVLVNLSADKGEIAEAAQALVANQRGTLFYDSIVEALDLGSQYGDGIPDRRAAFVFSDAEDYNVGGFIKEEVEARLENSEFPLYAIGLNNNSRAALDAFGAMARLSGGAIDVVTHATLQEAVAARVGSLTSGYVARFSSSTNMISGEKEDLELTVTFGEKSYSASAAVTPSRWIPDHVPPQVLSAEQTAPGTIEIRFDKPMQGADNVAGFRAEDGKGDLLALRAVSYDEAAYAATLTFSEQPPSGKITVSFPAVTDASMERNAVAEPVAIDFRGATPTPALDPNAQPDPADPAGADGDSLSPVIWLFVSLVIALIVVGVTLGVIKSRGGLVRVDGKLRFAGPARQEVYVTEEEADAVQYQFITEKPPEISLRVIDGAGNTRDIQTPVSGSVFVGRGQGNDISFDDPRMSRQHFVIEARGDGFVIQNLSESGQTFLNGIPIGTAHPLAQGDKVVAGNITFIRI